MINQGEEVDHAFQKPPAGFSKRHEVLLRKMLVACHVLGLNSTKRISLQEILGLSCLQFCSSESGEMQAFGSMWLNIYLGQKQPSLKK